MNFKGIAMLLEARDILEGREHAGGGGSAKKLFWSQVNISGKVRLNVVSFMGRFDEETETSSQC